MPELRKDPIIGRWVIISTGRASRPQDFKAMQDMPKEPPCPFCSGKESNTPPEIFTDRSKGRNTKANKPGWNTRVVPSISPVLRIEGDLDRHGKGMYDMMNAVGAHEVIIETPEHIANIANLPEEQIVRVLNTYIQRISDLQKDKRFKYTLLFKNYGFGGNGKIRHSRSQIIAMPANPKRVKEELVGSKRYYDFKERCIFCDIIKQELDNKQRVVIDTDEFIAFTPFASRFPFETWIMPKEHSADFIKTKKQKLPNLAKVLKLTLLKLSKALDDAPYNFILHTAPFRVPIAGYWKTIDYDYHWHIEIMPRLSRVAGFEWGTGFYINPTPPEEAAGFLRETDI